MKTFIINQRPGWQEWREHARAALSNGYLPHELTWQYKDDVVTQDLFATPLQDKFITHKKFNVPKKFLELAEYACCHNAPDRFALLYRILWRLCHDNKNLLHLKTDDDVLKLQAYVKAVRRDAYKIKAFLRFREVKGKTEEHFIAWYEPEHYSLEISLPFFQTRFKNMNWSILTPYRAGHWDKENIVLANNPDPSIYPQDDNIEKYWLSYYASTFNPARPKKAAMLNQMPKKYWKNMPETVLIKELLNTSEARARKMIQKSQA